MGFAGVAVIFSALILLSAPFTKVGMGHTSVLSPLLAAYAVPGMMFILTARAARARQDQFVLLITSIVGGGLLFLFLNMEIRHLFAGPFLREGAIVDSEMYAYSAAWIAFAAMMMAYGMHRALPVVRKLALAMVALTVCKVFLIDLAALEGLYRALSFLGLGGALMALATPTNAWPASRRRLKERRRPSSWTLKATSAIRNP